LQLSLLAKRGGNAEIDQGWRFPFQKAPLPAKEMAA